MRTLAALLTGVALIALPTTGSSIGFSVGGGPGDITPSTEVEYGTELGEMGNGLPRGIIVNGSTWPRDNCFKGGLVQGYTTIILNLSDGETLVDAFRDLEQLGIQKEFLQQLGRTVFDNNHSDYQNWSAIGWDYFKYTQGVLAEPEPIIATFYQECPQQPLPKTQYLEGKITDQQANIEGLSFTLDAKFGLFEGRVFVGNRIQVIPNGTARLYSENGFPSNGAISRFDKLEVLDKKEKVLFTYGPQNFYSSYIDHNHK